MGKPHRLGGFDYRGRVLLFITCVAHRRHLAFESADVCDTVIGELRTNARRFAAEITAYCLMPDHVHLLLAGETDESDLPALLRHWKQSTGYAYRQRQRRRLWQGNYWDRLLRHDDEAIQITRYLITDPIRSGLVQSLAQYAWWGSEVWSREQLLDSLGDSARPPWWREP